LRYFTFFAREKPGTFAQYLYPDIVGAGSTNNI